MSDKRVIWDMPHILSLPDNDDKCYSLSSRDIVSLLQIHPQNMWATRYNTEDPNEIELSRSHHEQLIEKLLSGGNCTPDEVAQICSIVLEYMHMPYGQVRIKSPEGRYAYLCAGSCTFEWADSGVTGTLPANEQPVNPDALSLGYQLTPPLATEQGNAASLAIGQCDLSTAFISDYLMPNFVTYIQTIRNAKEAGQNILFALEEFFEAVVIGEILQPIATFFRTVDLRFLDDLEANALDVSYIRACQRTMKGLSKPGNNYITRELLLAWARNTPLFWGTQFTPMQPTMVAYVSALNLEQARFEASVLRGNGDEDLCSLLGIGAPQSENTGSIGGAINASYWITNPVRISGSFQNGLVGGEEYTPILNVNAPAGCVGVLYTLHNVSISGQSAGFAIHVTSLASQTPRYSNVCRIVVNNPNAADPFIYVLPQGTDFSTSEVVIQSDTPAVNALFPNATSFKAIDPADQIFEATSIANGLSIRISGAGQNNGSTIYDVSVQIIYNTSLVPVGSVIIG